MSRTHCLNQALILLATKRLQSPPHFPPCRIPSSLFPLLSPCFPIKNCNQKGWIPGGRRSLCTLLVFFSFFFRKGGQRRTIRNREPISWESAWLSKAMMEILEVISDRPPTPSNLSCDLPPWSLGRPLLAQVHCDTYLPLTRQANNCVHQRL